MAIAITGRRSTSVERDINFLYGETWAIDMTIADENGTALSIASANLVWRVSSDSAVMFNATEFTSGAITSISFNATGNLLEDSANGLTLINDALAVVSGSTSNDNVYQVLTPDSTGASVAMDASPAMITEAAGDTVTVTSGISITGGGTGGLCTITITPAIQTFASIVRNTTYRHELKVTFSDGSVSKVMHGLLHVGNSLFKEFT